MTDQRHQDLTEVEALLATRQQLNGWLEKLDAAGAKTPPSVRDRVRSDYQARLNQVVEQLRGHSDVISNTLQGLRTQAEEFEQFRTEEQETLAEAELRFSVGEYTNDEWTRVERDSTGKISGLDQELERLAAEIGRLEDVLTQIVPQPAAPPPSRPAEATPIRAATREVPPKAVEPPLVLIRDEPPSTPAPVAEAPAAAPVAREPAETPEAPRFVPRGGLRNSGPARTIAFPAQPAPVPRDSGATAPVDELTFLKSMTLDPPPPRSAAAHSNAAVAESKPTDRPGPTVAKTLKCGECGALNRPTEWYCERCGAELAAV